MARAKVSELLVGIQADARGFHKEMRTVTGRFQKSLKSMKRQITGFGATIAGELGAMLAFRGIEIGKNLISGIVDTNLEVERMIGTLETMVGSQQKAQEEFKRLNKFAAETPFTLQQSVEGFTKLMALGLDPSQEAMKSFGNTASAMGKDMQQMIEAVADASTFEFERLKEFGIKAKQQGDQVTFTFRGVSTTIEKESSAIIEYLKEIGETDFAGAMEKQMEGLPGKLSNLEQNFDNLKIAIGQGGFTSAVGDAADEMSRFLTDIIDSGKAAEIGKILGESFRAVTSALITMVDWIGTATTKLNSFFNGVGNEFMAWWYGVDPQAVANLQQRESFVSPNAGVPMEIEGPAIIADLKKIETVNDQIKKDSEQTTRSWDKLRDIGERINKQLQQRREYLQSQVSAVKNAMMTDLDFHRQELSTMREALEFGVINKEEFQQLTQFIKDEYNGIIEASRRAAQQMQANFSDIFLDAMHGKFDNFFQKIINGFDRLAADLLARNLFTSLEPFFLGGGAGSFGRFLFGGGRAMGGPVTAGRAYMVGEQGPEMFVPNTSGMIQPNEGGISIGDININGQVNNPKQTGAQISREILANLQNARMRGDI